MSVIFILLPLGVVLSALATLAYMWAVRRGQFDDTQTPALRILTDDEDALSELKPVGANRTQAQPDVS